MLISHIYSYVLITKWDAEKLGEQQVNEGKGSTFMRLPWERRWGRKESAPRLWWAMLLKACELLQRTVVVSAAGSPSPRWWSWLQMFPE